MNKIVAIKVFGTKERTKSYIVYVAMKPSLARFLKKKLERVKKKYFIEANLTMLDVARRSDSGSTIHKSAFVEILTILRYSKMQVLVSTEVKVLRNTCSAAFDDTIRNSSDSTLLDVAHFFAESERQLSAPLHEKVAKLAECISWDGAEIYLDQFQCEG